MPLACGDQIHKVHVKIRDFSIGPVAYMWVGFRLGTSFCTMFASAGMPGFMVLTNSLYKPQSFQSSLAGRL